MEGQAPVELGGVFALHVRGAEGDGVLLGPVDATATHLAKCERLTQANFVVARI